MTIRYVHDAEHAVFDAGAGRPLLFVHGFPLDHRMWEHQLTFFSEGYRVIAPDLRGFGQSSTPDGPVQRMQDFADDLAAILDALEITEKVVLCGLSMGGYIGWQFGLRHPERLAGLILCDTKSVGDSTEAAQQRNTLAETVLASGAGVLAETMPQRLLSAESQSRQTALTAAIAEQIHSASPVGMAAALRGMAIRTDVSQRLIEFPQPALIVVGQHDAISPPDEMQQIAQALPQATFAEIESAGHLSPWEQPARFNEVVANWLEQVPF